MKYNINDIHGLEQHNSVFEVLHCASKLRPAPSEISSSWQNVSLEDHTRPTTSVLSSSDTELSPCNDISLSTRSDSSFVMPKLSLGTVSIRVLGDAHVLPRQYDKHITTGDSFNLVIVVLDGKHDDALVHMALKYSDQVPIIPVFTGSNKLLQKVKSVLIPLNTACDPVEATNVQRLNQILKAMASDGRRSLHKIKHKHRKSSKHYTTAPVLACSIGIGIGLATAVSYLCWKTTLNTEMVDAAVQTIDSSDSGWPEKRIIIKQSLQSFNGSVQSEIKLARAELCANPTFGSLCNLFDEFCDWAEIHLINATNQFNIINSLVAQV